MQYSNTIKIPRTNLIARARLVPPMLTQVMFLVLRSLKQKQIDKSSIIIVKIKFRQGILKSGASETKEITLRLRD